ncbi:molybdate ABC transporter substrate-binding protein [Variovorax sp. LARHSF232]
MWKQLLAALCLTVTGWAHGQEGPTVAAASDLKFALDEVLAQYQAQSGKRVRVTYGSSGNFFTQIGQGAPFEIFLSADEGFVYQLADKGLTQDRGALYATGRIVLFAPNGSLLVPDSDLADLGRSLKDGRLLKFAIANPEHAPYGRAAKEALTSKGLWSAIEPKLVLGENVSQAAQFAVSGSTQGGIFAYSLALSPNFAGAGKFVLIPESLHQPLRQRMVLTKKAGAPAQALYAYLQQPAARTVLKKYGFVLPGE